LRDISMGAPISLDVATARSSARLLVDGIDPLDGGDALGRVGL
jgi:hypothetical protein